MKINSNNTQINTYRNTDLALSAFLALQFELLGLDNITGNRYEFVFNKTSALEEAVKSFFNNTARVSPSDYFNSIKSLKTRIYSRS
jgi:hypothetical protein